MITLDDLTKIDDADEQTVVIVNAWLNKHKIRAFDTIPAPIKQAGRYIAKAWLDGVCLPHAPKVRSSQSHQRQVMCLFQRLMQMDRWGRR